MATNIYHSPSQGTTLELSNNLFTIPEQIFASCQCYVTLTDISLEPGSCLSGTDFDMPAVLVVNHCVKICDWPENMTSNCRL